jgi:hypothetical protein
MIRDHGISLESGVPAPERAERPVAVEPDQRTVRSDNVNGQVKVEAHPGGEACEVVESVPVERDSTTTRP